MDRWSFHEEAQRLSARADVSDAPALLASFVVEVAGNPGAYARRVRSALVAGVQLAIRGEFESDELPESNVPGWFSSAGECEVDDLAEVPESIEGQRRYVEHRGEEPWEVQDWLWSFEPGKRQWLWWDLTAAGGNVVQIWLYSRSEPVFQCEDVRWLAYSAGARAAVGPILLPSQVWNGQTSLGI
ncbi:MULTISPECIES: hypothetical protein [unclassified Streptomyces]|uniref:hypothetical protein n=1 Tax=unclassified Streptomyces TaxID=2593676 RepID=UPI003415EFE4